MGKIYKRSAATSAVDRGPGPSAPQNFTPVPVPAVSQPTESTIRQNLAQSYTFNFHNAPPLSGYVQIKDGCQLRWVKKAEAVPQVEPIKSAKNLSIYEKEILLRNRSFRNETLSSPKVTGAHDSDDMTLEEIREMTKFREGLGLNKRVKGDTTGRKKAAPSLTLYPKNVPPARKSVPKNSVVKPNTTALLASVSSSHQVLSESLQFQQPCPGPAQSTNICSTFPQNIPRPIPVPDDHAQMKLFISSMFPIQGKSTSTQGVDMQQQFQKMTEFGEGVIPQIQKPSPADSGIPNPQFTQPEPIDYLARFGTGAFSKLAEENKKITTEQMRKSKSKKSKALVASTKKIETSKPKKSKSSVSVSTVPMDYSSVKPLDHQNPSLISNPEKSKTAKGVGFGNSTINKSPPTDPAFTSVFQVKPLQKGTARIPKLTVAKNKNLNLIGGHGRSTLQMERMKTSTGLGRVQSTSSSLWPSLENLNPTPTQISPSSVMPNHHQKKYERKEKTSTTNSPKTETEPEPISFSLLLQTCLNLANSATAMTQVSKSNGAGKTAELQPISSSGFRHPVYNPHITSDLTPEEEQELKRGYGHNWAYPEHERNYLYSVGKYVIRRQDVGKPRESVDVWRIEEGFITMRRYRPHVDFNRVFHVGKDDFVAVKKDINIYRHYQPVYVLICFQNENLQIIQYFQDERFLQHLFFMMRNEILYEDYFHLLQILICQVMDKKVIRFACLNKAGDYFWKKSWNATESTLTRISNEIRKYSRWNQNALKPVEIWPRMTMCSTKVDKTRHCDSCIGGQRVPYKRIEFSGSPYDRNLFVPRDRFKGKPPTSLQYCFNCSILLRRWSRIVHAKNDIFTCVKQRIVQICRAVPPDIKLDASSVRDYLMNDNIWVRRMFLDYLIVLAEAHKAIDTLQRELSLASRSRK